MSFVCCVQKCFLFIFSIIQQLVSQNSTNDSILYVCMKIISILSMKI